MNSIPLTVAINDVDSQRGQPGITPESHCNDSAFDSTLSGCCFP